MAPEEVDQAPEEVDEAKAEADLKKVQAERLKLQTEQLKLEAERSKLEKENAILDGPWWLRPTFLSVIAPTVTALGAVFTLVYFISSGIESLSLARVQAEAKLAELEARDAKADRDKLDAQTKAIAIERDNALRAIAATKDEARCLLAHEFFVGVRRAGFQFAAMSQQYNPGALRVLGPAQLGWSAQKIEQEENALGHWPNATWKVLDHADVLLLGLLESFVDLQANYITALLKAQDLARDPNNTFAPLFGATPKRPPPLTGLLLLDQAKAALKGATSMIGAVDAALGKLDRGERYDLEVRDLAFGIVPDDQRLLKTELVNGDAAKVPDDVLRSFADELLRHYAAHVAVEKAIGSLEHQVLGGCP